MTGTPAPVPGLPTPVRDVSVRVLKNIGSCGPYAYVVAQFEPPDPRDGPPGPDGLELLNAVPERHLPPEFLPALRSGLVAGLDGVAATVLLTDGGFHEVDSSEPGFRLAGRCAGRAALIGAGLLPPHEAASLPWTTWPGRPWLGPKRRAGRGAGGGTGRRGAGGP